LLRLDTENSFQLFTLHISCEGNDTSDLSYNLTLKRLPESVTFEMSRRPERFIYIPEEVSEIDWAIREMANARYLSVDIETVEDQITCIGFAWSAEHALVIPIWDFSKSDRSYWGHNEEVHVWHRIRDICGMPIPKVFQNGLYDIHFLWRRYGIMPANCEHDTMLLHHALQPEMQKGLRLPREFVYE
jgi:hypothetical protein